MKINAEISLREWQKVAFKRWKENNYCGIFSVVTGGGKTIFALFCAKHLFDTSQVRSLYVIVPTNALKDQWASTIMSVLKIPKDKISFNIKKTKNINVITNLAAQKISVDKNYSDSAVILDECHRYGTPNNLSYLNLSFKAKIGLTATLQRNYDDGVENILIPKIGKVAYTYDIQEALKDGIVENYHLYNVRTFLSEEEQKEYNAIDLKIKKLFNQLRQSEDLENQNFLNDRLKLLLIKRKRIVNDSDQRSLLAARIILDNIERKKIIFCESIEQAEKIQFYCKQAKLDTLIYHSGMNRSLRIDNLCGFYNNFYHTLIGCKALDEGFDVPDIDFAVIVSQSNSSRQRIQRLGRSIRKDKNKLKPEIYTFYTTEDERKALEMESHINPNITTQWMEVKV